MVGIRYIPSIEDEAKTIALAQRARGLGLEKISSIKKAYNLIFERLVTTLVSILRKTLGFNFKKNPYNIDFNGKSLFWFVQKKN
jgi:hypothetical protein